MEIIRVAQPRIRERLSASIPTVSQLISDISLYSPNRALNQRVEQISIDGFSSQLSDLRAFGVNADIRQEVAALYYTDKLGNFPSRRSVFAVNRESQSIPLKFDTPEIDASNPRFYRPKMESVGAVGAIAQFVLKRTLPQASNLRHLLYETIDYKAATAAFFLTISGDIFAFYRGVNTPQYDRKQAERAVGGFDRSLKYLIEERGHAAELARASLLREYVSKLDLQFFHGLEKNGVLVRSSPEKHIFN